MSTVHEKERSLQRQIAEQVEGSLPGVEVLAVELDGPASFCVYVDSAGGVDHALCERVTNVLREYLREYDVEVSSPGAERPLRDRDEFERFLGRKVNLRHRYGETSEGVIEGTLVSVDDAGVAVESKGGPRVEVAWPDVLAARLAVSL
jgi:ribosome maturation factor RimP